MRVDIHGHVRYKHYVGGDGLGPLPAAAITHLKGTVMIKSLLLFLIILLVATFPATWLLMLFIGNVAPGVGLGYFGTLPLGILVSALIGGLSSNQDW